MRKASLIAGVILLVFSTLIGGCAKAVSATQPSPGLQLGERVAAGFLTAALEHAYTKGDITYPEYSAAATALKKLYVNAQANGGAITKADIEDAIGAGLFKLLEQYMPPEPRVLPPAP